MHSPSRKNVRSIFNQIAFRYDLLNHLLSFGIDKRWRNKLINMIAHISHESLLDLATGTGDLIIGMAKQLPHLKETKGIDLSENMLEIAKEKAKKVKNHKIMLEVGDIQDLNIKANTFDVVTIAFGIRNVEDTNRGIQEMVRVLKPGGSLYILEFSLPKSWIIRKFYLFYFRHVLPLIGGLLSGSKSSYTYLNQTVESFPYGEEFVELLTKTKLCETKATPLTFGIATIYQGKKT
jgi:demethylmenaquinone methyltransferase / 2-methoxy-6-polyprenyl-1,4-benzoquinol methylase